MARTRRVGGWALALGGLVLAGLTLAGCQSTQAPAARQHGMAAPAPDYPYTDTDLSQSD